MRVLFSLAVVGGLAGCGEPATTTSEAVQSSPAEVRLAASHWPAGEKEKYLELELESSLGIPEAIGYLGAVSGSNHAFAQRAGLEALMQGGSSADAAITTSLAQTALGAGATISYFGILTVVHYDAASGEVSSMNASWNTVLGEDDPLSIPGEMEIVNPKPNPSARTALVGGFMKGVEALSERFGKLPFASLFDPAIEIAEEGFVWGESQDRFYLSHRKEILSHLPESRAVFTQEDGSWLEAGDIFRQPALAKTLSAVATRPKGATICIAAPGRRS